MKFKLKAQVYNWKHFIIIPYQCDPIGTIALGIQKLCTALTNVFQVLVIAKFIDSAILVAQGELTSTEVLPWLALLMALVGWKRVSFNIGKYFVKKIQIRVEEQLSKEFTDKRARMVYSQVENPETWDLVNRVCKNIEIHVSEMLQRTFNFMLYLIRITGVLLIIFTQIWWVGILITLLTIPLIPISLKGGKTAYTATKSAAQYDRRYQYISEVLSGREAADERTLFAFTNHLNQYWHEQFEQSRIINLKAEIRRSLNMYGGSAITNILSSVIILALIFPTVSGELSQGMFIAIATAVYDLIKLMGEEMTRVVSQLSKYNEYIKEFTILANIEEVEGVTDLPTTEQQVFKTLEFKNVSFKYPGTDTYILKDMNMVLENGIHYAFVGANGAGKTTVTKLITGLYTNFEGEILINEKSIKAYKQKELKAMFSGIYQDFAKYHISAEENILIGNINSLNNNDSKEKMIHITKDLDIYEALSSLPKGFQTPLGKLDEESVDLSGGQWQRIAMSRALMSPAPVKILDEPTAALDPISESKLYEEFEKISKGKTSIFISHRLGSTKIADKIFVLEKGRIAEEGSHKKLIDQKGIYYTMFESQRSWYQ
ncbi:ATP-binding cassette subfamily B protein [Natranaerovirga pectinivora]|uniref:ATP-binding cassette subfamily B protein n=1 Tax=Natranaerovirga pectinivora TaxID=682400 RepID=A0A4R3MSH6_9FIRM|nr:ABC transporter ATP-binding protein [Natranaerovirga pectinivora]TCT17188.1 ATP-binding cassette subfamily B protein [Natranaerovirga pectinivora]